MNCENCKWAREYAEAGNEPEKPYEFKWKFLSALLLEDYVLSEHSDWSRRKSVHENLVACKRNPETLTKSKSNYCGEFQEKRGDEMSMDQQFGLAGKTPKTNVGGRPKKVDASHEGREKLRQRCKMMGWRPTDENLIKAKADHLECLAGIALEKAGFNRDLWETMKEIRGVYMRSFAMMGVCPHAQNGHPQIIPSKADIQGHEPVNPLLDPIQREARDIASKESMRRIDAQLLEYIPNDMLHVKDVLIYGYEPSARFVPAIRAFYELRRAK